MRCGDKSGLMIVALVHPFCLVQAFQGWGLGVSFSQGAHPRPWAVLYDPFRVEVQKDWRGGILELRSLSRRGGSDPKLSPTRPVQRQAPQNLRSRHLRLEPRSGSTTKPRVAKRTLGNEKLPRINPEGVGQAPSITHSFGGGEIRQPTVTR